jgi:hypothetical protein
MKRFSLLALLSLLPFALAGGVSGRAGLDAVAVSADGKWIAAGGQNRVVYLIDADTLEVKKRVHLGARIGGLAFSRDGTRLVVEDETDALHLMDTATAKVVAKLPNLSGLLADPSGDQVIVRDLSDPERPRLRRLSTAKLESLGLIDMDSRASAYSLDATGKRLVILSASRPGDEKRVPANEVPRELTGLARWKFRLEYDGLVSQLSTLDLATGKVLGRKTLWYTSDSENTVVVPGDKTTYVLNRVNICAKIAGDKIDLFETADRINYALAASPDNKTLLAGGIGTGTHGPVEGKRTRFEVAPLPGQPEMFTRFAVRADGSAVGVTSAFRVVRISREGKVEKVAAVY